MSSYARRPLPADALKELAPFPPLLASLLAGRGVVTVAHAERFLAPDYKRDVLDPFLLLNMEKAVTRVLSAMQKKERIIVYGDYDMDGIPGAVVLHDFFKKVGYEHAGHYVPHRNREGFGLNTKALDQLADEGAQLIITVDCGIGDVEQVAHANHLGLEVIITDHHLPGEKLPEAFAVVNPNQPACTYPNKALCGAGVAFKLVQGLIARGTESGQFSLTAGWEKWLLDMAGMATIADMVALTGENRALAYYGLTVLRKSPRPGLQKLLRRARLDQRFLAEDDVGFMIAPRINAASRMGEAKDAYRLFSTDDEGEADALVEHLEHLNNERKGIVAAMAKEIKKRIAQLGEPREVIVMGNPAWKPSLLGLAANALMEEYARPVFLWGREEGVVIKGSCRSDGSASVVEIMRHAKESFIEYGGHEFSGGFSVESEHIHTLEDALLSAYKKAKRDTTSTPRHLIDAEVSLDDVTWATYKHIERLAPFGMGNHKPIFLFPHSEVVEVKRFGKGQEHLEVVFLKTNGGRVSAIGFFTSPEQFEGTLTPGRKVDLLATFEKSNFRGRPELRLRIVDIKFT